MNPPAKVLRLGRYDYLNYSGAHSRLPKNRDVIGRPDVIIRDELFLVVGIGRAVGENNRVAASDDSQVIGARHRLREAVGVADPEYTADAQRSSGGTFDRQPASSVAIELLRGVAQ